MLYAEYTRMPQPIADVQCQKHNLFYEIRIKGTEQQTC